MSPVVAWATAVPVSHARRRLRAAASVIDEQALFSQLLAAVFSEVSEHQHFLWKDTPLTTAFALAGSADSIAVVPCGRLLCRQIH